MVFTVFSDFPSLGRLSPVSGVPDHEHHEAEEEAGHPRDHVGRPPALAENIEPRQVNTRHLQANVHMLAEFLP